MPPKLLVSARGASICVIGAVVTLFHLQIQLFLLASFHSPPSSLSQSPNRDSSQQEQKKHTLLPDCAINLFGLPRSFESLVLPSLEKHVIQTNPKCDVFVHYYNQTTEAGGRSGAGGQVHAEQIRLLTQVVHKYNPHATVKYAVTTEAEFTELYKELTETMHTTKDSSDRYIYFPWRAVTYKYPITVDNILKMWHSIQSSWNLMKQHMLNQQDARKGRGVNGSSYTRVAMLRSDVLYLTPIRIWEIEGGQVDRNNTVAVIPGFARYPVSDRAIYGPYQAVEQWAAHRFDRVHDHAQWMLKHHPGWGMHSERFVHYSILPHILEKGYRVWEHDRMCFLRARADESVWVTDCMGKSETEANPHVLQTAFHIDNASDYDDLKRIQRQVVSSSRQLVEQVLGRRCVPGNVTHVRLFTKALHCGTEDNLTKQPQG